MHISSLIKKLLNVNDIIVKDVRFETDRKGGEILVVAAMPSKRRSGRCPVCGRKGKGYDSGNRTTRWRAPTSGQ